MCQFTDHKGDTWTLLVTYGSGKRVLAETGVNLGNISQDMSWVDMIFGDTGKLVSVLWVLCAEQAKDKGVTPEEFGERFDGPTLEAAGIALANSVSGFVPRSKIAKAIQNGLSKVLEVADEKAVRAVNDAVSTACAAASNSPESSESTPPG